LPRCGFPGGAHLLAPEVLVVHVQSFDTAAADLPIRRLSAADLTACVELAADRGWPPERNKLRLLFAVGEAYGVDDPAFSRRLSAYLPLFGCRWVLIMLNEFIPELWRRRALAGDSGSWSEAKTRQLAKARDFLRALPEKFAE